MAVSVEILEQLHPEYATLLPQWEECDDMYQGWPNVGRRLYRYFREGDKAYALRLERAYYRNYIKPIVRLWISYVYRAGVSRDAGSSEWLKEVWDDCDRRKRSMTRWMTTSGFLANRTGDCLIVVDRKNPAQKPKSRRQQREQRDYPYVVRYRSSQLVNWERDEEGELTWIRVRETPTRNISPFQKMPQNAIVRYRTWTRDEWFIHDVVIDRTKKTLVVPKDGEGKHGLGFVPCVLYCGETDEEGSGLRGQPVTLDMCRTARAIFSWLSILDESLYQNGVPIMTRQVPAGDDEEEEDEQLLSSYDTMDYPVGCERPGFMERPVGSIESISAAIDKEAEQIHRMAAFGGNQFSRPQTVPSGVALSYLLADLEQLLNDKADSAQEVETKIAKTMCAWMDEEFDGSIRYGRKFLLDDLAAELERVTAIKRTIRSDTAKREAEKRYARKEFADLDRETLDVIEQEIDESQDQALIETDELTGLPVIAGARQRSVPPAKTEADTAEDAATMAEEHPGSGRAESMMEG